MSSLDGQFSKAVSGKKRYDQEYQYLLTTTAPTLDTAPPDMGRSYFSHSEGVPIVIFYPLAGCFLPVWCFDADAKSCKSNCAKSTKAFDNSQCTLHSSLLLLSAKTRRQPLCPNQRNGEGEDVHVSLCTLCIHTLLQLDYLQ